MVGTAPTFAVDSFTSPDWRVKKEIELGKAFSDSTINVSVFRQAAILPIGTDFLTSLYDASGYVKILRFNSDGQILGSIKVLPRIEERLLADGHCVVSMGLSSDGFIHITYGAHGTLPFQARIPVLKTIGKSAVRALPWSGRITYPQYYRIRQKLHFFYRMDASWFMREWDEAGAVWSAPRMLLDGSNTSSVYIDHLGIDGNDIFMSWVYRMPSTGAEQIVNKGIEILSWAFRIHIDRIQKVVNKGIYYAVSHDGGISWLDAAGRKLSLPIMFNKASRGLDISLSNRLMNQNSGWLASNGVAYLVYQSRDGDGVAQIFLSGIEPGSGRICTTTVSLNKVAYELSGMGTLLLPLSRAKVITTETKIHVIYRDSNRIIVATSDREAGVCGGKWRYFTPLTEPLLGWEPNFDMESYKAGRGLLLYVQPARQGKSDMSENGEAASAKIYWLEENKL